jgi:thiol-disulfide isomerase/thioredoxin
MKNKNIIYIVSLIVAAVALAGILSFFNEKVDTGPGQYDTLATCMQEKGIKFYGAFWCPHCREQKKLFGNSAKLLPYVECSTPDASGQTQICIDKKIESYPTWEFADGTRQSGAILPADLATKTQCPLTEATTTATSTIVTPIIK